MSTIVKQTDIEKLFRVEKKNQTKVKTAEEIKNAKALLKQSAMFAFCDDRTLTKIANKLNFSVYNENEILIGQAEPTEKLFLMAEHSVKRYRGDDGLTKSVETEGTSAGSLHLVRSDPCYSTIVCKEDNTTVYTLSQIEFDKLIKSEPLLATQIIYSLSRQIRGQSKELRSIKPTKFKQMFLFTSCGATIESFYRSALNSGLNAKLSGKIGKLFPDMHIQVPSRVIYINGFKGIREYLTHTYDAESFAYPTLASLGIAVTPGIVMTPVSSVLEACNAGHLNPESIPLRSIRGMLPRGLREIIFGIGLNQLTDYCEEHVPEQVESDTLRNLCGSLIAGVMCGYLSHVPHNLGSLKLFKPHVKYPEHFRRLREPWMERTKRWNISPGLQKPISNLCTVLAPTGVLIRTTQIVGSFIILNGTIRVLSNHFIEKKKENLSELIPVDTQQY